MSTIRFYGASDDLVEIDGAMHEEFNVYERPFIGHLVRPSGEKLTVVASYGFCEQLGSTWLVAPILHNDGDVLPDWNVRFEQQSEYSLAMLVDAPDDTILIVDDEVVCRAR